MSARPTLSLTRKTPLKSKKASTNGVKKKAPVKPWVDTINDLGQYKPTKTEVESRKNQRKSNNKILAKVAMNDKRMLNDPDRQKFIEQQVMRDIQRQPSQNVEAILARSEHVMGICQRILCGDLTTPGSAPLAAPLTPLRQPVYTPALPPQSPPGPPPPLSPAGSFASIEYEEPRLDTLNLEHDAGNTEMTSKVAPAFTPAHALGEVTAELLLTVRELREELLQEREARERLQQEVLQQRLLLADLAREVLRLQINCSGGVALAANNTAAAVRGKAERSKKGVAVMERREEEEEELVDEREEEEFMSLAPPKQADNSISRR
jgi:hypothetical protein